MPTWPRAAFALGFVAAALTAQVSGPVDHARAVLAAMADPGERLEWPVE
jgi:hypothetical protein